MNRNRMKKRIIASTMVAMVTATSVPAGSLQFSLPSIVKAAGLTTTTEDGLVIENGVLIDYKGEKTEVVIPEGVTEIGDGVFFETDVISVTLPKGLQIIGDDAFYFSKIENINLPDGVTAIGNNAFSNTKLTSIEIPNSVKQIGKSAFFSCENLSKAVISEGVEKIGEYAFEKTALTNITLPKSILEVGYHAFENCESLTSATIKNGALDESVFENCTALENIILEDGVTDIGISAFLGCKNLQKIVIPSTVEKIGTFAFNRCEALETAEIKDGVKEIGNYAFYNLPKLNNVIFGEGLKRIGDAAFADNSLLKKIDLVSVEEMGESVFDNCSGITDVILHTGVKRLGTSSFKNCKNIQNVTIEPGLEYIGENAFEYAEKLKEISIPSTVSVIDDDAFGFCNNLVKVDLPASLKYLSKSAVDSTIWYENRMKEADNKGDIYVVEGNILLGTTSKISEESKLNIPEGVTMIADLGDTNINKIVIPENIHMIGSGAFTSCNNLEELVFPDSITYMGDSLAFQRNNLRKVILPSNLQSISEMTFYECSALEEINMPQSLKSIGWSAFEKCSNLTKVTIPEGVKSINMEAFTECTSLKVVNIPASVEYIGFGAFHKCNNDLVIEGYTGSAAESFATENNMKFQSIGTINPDVVATSTPTVQTTAKPTAPTIKPEETDKVKPTATVDTTTDPVITPTADIPTGPAMTVDPSDTPEPTKDVNPTKEPEQTIEPTITPEGYVITLDANGGITDKNYITATNGHTYNDLPSASKDGCIFAGWYTDIEEGTKIDNVTSVNLSSDQTLYAHWIQKDCVVSFDGNEGSVDGSSEKTVLFGDIFGELPKATKSGATFLGWYTSKEGGNLVTEDMLVNFTGKVTLYAHWESAYKKMTEESLTYKFENTNEGFEYAEDYNIPLSVYQYMYGNSSYAKELFDSKDKWEGNCFGMSSSSVMFNVNGDGMEVSNFSANSTLPSQLNLSDVDINTQLTLKRFIEAMQISQYDSDISETISNNWDNLGNLYKAVQDSEKGEGEPVIICVYGPEGGHAMVGYKADDKGIYVYDPNFPNDNTRAIKISKNNNDEADIWSYKTNDSFNWGSSYENCAISFVPYSVFYHVWEKNGEKCFNELNMIRISSDNVKILDEYGQEAAQVIDGKLYTSNSDIMQIMNTKVRKDGMQNENQGVELFLPSKKYTIENSGKDKVFKIKIFGTDIYADIETEASKITINLDDLDKENQIIVHAKSNEQYQINLKSMAYNDKENLVVKGTSTDKQDVQVSQSQGDIQLLKCENAAIKVNGKNVNQVKLNAKSGNGGSISRKGNIGAVSGEDITYAITPDYGYMIKDVIVDGESQGNVSSYTFTNVSKDHTIEAVFEKADLSKASIHLLSDKLEVGVVPSLEVRIGNQILTEKDDYMVSCVKSTSSEMTLKITGRSFYNGTITKVVDLKSGNISDGDSSADKNNNPTNNNNTVKKGSTYKVGSFYYKVTNTSSKKVTLTKKAKSTKTVTVPATVKIKNEKYKVTAIGASVWKNDKKLETIKIGKNITSIGANAMNGAKKLKKIIINSTSLKSVGAKIFKNISPKAVIKVPKNKKEDYKKLFKGKGQKKTVKIK